MTTYARIVDWRSYQHYKDRSPPWIKLHRTQILDNRRYRLLSDSAQALFIDLMLLASEKDGVVQVDGADLEFRLRRSRDEIGVGVQALADAGFIQLTEQNHVLPLADASTAQARGERGRGERGGFPQHVKHDVEATLGGRTPPGPRLTRP